VDRYESWDPLRRSRDPHSNARSTSAERNIYQVWLMLWMPFHFMTGYVEVNVQRPSAKLNANPSNEYEAKLAETRLLPDAKQRVAGARGRGLEHPMWLIYGDDSHGRCCHLDAASLYFIRVSPYKR
jgi:hypothetical protein